MKTVIRTTIRTSYLFIIEIPLAHLLSYDIFSLDDVSLTQFFFSHEPTIKLV